MQQQLARLSLPICIHQHGSLYGVPIPNIVRRVLEVPFELAGLGVEGDVARGIEIVTEALIAIEVRTGVTRRPVDGAGLRILGSCHPGGTARMRNLLSLPGFPSRFTPPLPRPQ